MRFLRITILIFLIIVPVIMFLWLLDRDFAFSGVWDAEMAMDKESRLIEIVGDSKEEQVNGDVFRSFAKTPVYFNVKAPRVFNAARVESTFRTSAPLVEAGVMVKEETGQIRKTVVYNRDLETLDWTSVGSGASLDEENDKVVYGLGLWQRDKRYENPSEFLKNPPSIEKIMTINYDLQIPARLLNYQASAAVRNFNVSLRGPQTLYTYLEKENLNWTFFIQDMNRHDGTDEVVARVFDYQNKQVLEQTLVDDGEIWGSGKSSVLREFKLTAVLPDGVYKIQINAPDDIFIRQVRTSQQKFVFQYVIYFGDTAGYAGSNDPIQIVGQTRSLKFRTPHEEGKQNIQIGNDIVRVAFKDHGYEYNTKTRLVNFRLPKSDLKIDFDGFLSLTPEAFFMPKPLGFKWISDVKQFDLEYIIGYYQPAMSLRSPYENWFDTVGEVSLDGVDQSKKLKIFLIASSESSPEAPLDLTNLRVILKKEPFNFRALPAIILNKTRNLFIWDKL